MNRASLLRFAMVISLLSSILSPGLIATAETLPSPPPIPPSPPVPTQIVTLGVTPSTSYRLGDGRIMSLTQSFKAAGSSLTQVKVALARQKNPAFPITLSIRSSFSSGDLYTTTIQPSQVISTSMSSPTWITMPVNVSLMQGGIYYLRLSAGASNKSNYYRWPVDSTNPYPDGSFYYNTVSVSGSDALGELTFSGGPLVLSPSTSHASLYYAFGLSGAERASLIQSIQNQILELQRKLSELLRSVQY